MKKNDLVRGYDGWIARVTGIGKKNIKIQWETGVLKGREANVPKEHLKVVAKNER